MKKVLQITILIALVAAGWTAGQGLRYAQAWWREGPVVKTIDRAAPGMPDAKALVMLSQSTCPVCARARDWLDARHIAHQELVIDQSPEAQRIASLLDVRVVPVFLIGDTQLSGFDPDRLTALLPASATPR